MYKKPHKKKKPYKDISYRDHRHPQNKRSNTSIKASNISRNPKSHKRIKLKRLILISTIMLLILIIFFVIAYAISIISKFQHEDIDTNDIGIDEELFSKDELGITNIALLGVDDNGTSDAIIIASIDTNSKKIKMISILRDSLVKVEPKNKKSYYTKINEAYGNGGVETTLRAINSNFNLNVKDYISIKFDGLARIIDKIDGIDVNITAEESKHINGLIASTQGHESCPQIEGYGDVRLNGIQAIEYARIRKKLNQNGQRDDYGRTDRQRLVLETILKKVKQTPYNEIPDLIDTFLPYMKTSLSLNKILSLSKILKSDELSISQTRVPMVEYTINEGYNHTVNGTSKSTVYYNLKYAGKLINAFIYDDISPEDYMTEHPPVLTGGPLDNR